MTSCTIIGQKCTRGNDEITSTIETNLKRARMEEEPLFQYFNDFESKSKTEDFLSLDNIDFKQVITCDELDIIDEEVVYDALIRWAHRNYGHDKEQLELSILPNFISYIRFPQMDPKQVKAISEESFIQNSRKCLHVFEEAFNYFDHGVKPSTKSIGTSRRFYPRCSFRGGANIYFFSRAIMDKTPLFLIVYNPVENSMRRIPYSSTRDLAGYTIHRGSIYVVGGITYSDEHATVDRFHIKTEKWFRNDDVPPLKMRRFETSVIGLGKYVYVLGGTRGNETFNCVERYIIRLNLWESCSPMKVKRCSPGVAALNGLIYVFGGRSEEKELVGSGECYDPSKDSWKDIGEMKIARMSMSCIAHQGKIYAMGGCGAGDATYEIEVYDPLTNEWEVLPRSPNGFCRYAGLVGLGDKLCVIKSNGTWKNPVPSVHFMQEYNIKERKWTKVKSIVDSMMAGNLKNISWST